MALYPDCYLNRITDISKELLEDNNIKGLILDVDNTLIDYSKTPIEGLNSWFEGLKKQGITFCILSNSNKKEKVKKIANQLGIPFLYFGMKPFKKGFKQAKEILGLQNRNIGVVGDQIFTDIWGANRMKMYSILVKPIDHKDILITIIKRPLEKLIIKKYHKKKEVK